MPSCGTCRETTRAFEQQVARHSLLSLLRQMDGPSPRDPKDPLSGAFEPVYLLRPDAFGPHGEAAMLGGGKMRTLAAIEVDPRSLAGRKRAGDVRDMDQLLSLLDEIRDHKQDEVTVLLLEASDPIRADSTFWPRVFLDTRGRLRLRARNPEEAVQCLSIVLAALDRLRDHSGWQTSNVPDLTEHKVNIRHDKLASFRLATKVAYGLASLHPELDLASVDRFPSARTFVLEGGGGFSVDLITSPQAAVEADADLIPGYHAALIHSDDSTVRAYVSLSGLDFALVLGSFGGGISPFGARSRRDGKETRLLTSSELHALLETIRSRLQAFKLQKEPLANESPTT